MSSEGVSGEEKSVVDNNSGEEHDLKKIRAARPSKADKKRSMMTEADLSEKRSTLPSTIRHYLAFDGGRDTRRSKLCDADQVCHSTSFYVLARVLSYLGSLLPTTYLSSRTLD